MDEKKKDLIPIAAIAVFLVIIIILCVVRLNDRKSRAEDNNAAPTESVEMIYSGEAPSKEETQTPSAEIKETKPVKAAETQEQDPAANRIPTGKDKEQPGKKTQTAEGKTISGNDPFAGAESVHKTNEEMLMEMAGYWQERNMDAVEDLAHLGWYMKMSASIADEDTFYYYGERNAEGAPEGTGIAAYAGNEYYYGQWVNGRREGEGQWIKYYVYYDDDTVSDRAYKQHMYAGEWANDMPNGDGHEHYELDMSKAQSKDRYLQNVIGSFKDGLYSGEMYLTTLSWDENQEEWNGMAEEGIWSPYAAATNKKEVPICQDVDEASNYLWIAVRENKDRGISELMP